MLTFLKKLSIRSYLLIGAAVLAIVGLIIGIVSGAKEEFPIRQIPFIITLTILAVLLIGGTIYLVTRFGEKPWISAILFVTVLVLAFCFYLMFMGKTELMGTIWFSSLDRGYKAAEDALMTGVVSLAFYIVSALVVAVTAFFKIAKKEK